MKAWQIDGFGTPFQLRDVPVPQVRPGAVLVKIETSSLMSYLKEYVEGKLRRYRPPQGAFTPGGNGFGTIEAVGRDVWHLKPGQRVILSSHLVTQENVEDKAQILIGVTNFGGVGEALQKDWPDGTLAEYALYPVSTVTPVEGLDHIPAEQFSIFSRCVVPYGGLVRGRLAAGETIIINGITGAYGTTAALVAMAMGAGKVIGVGRNKHKLDAVAAAMGGRIETVALTGDVKVDTEALRRLTGGGAEMAFDMVGQADDPSATLATLGGLRRNGRLVLMGSMATPIPVDYMQLMGNNLEIIGHLMYEADAHLKLLNLLRIGRLDLSPIKATVFPMTAVPEAMEAARVASSLECIVVRN
ncbi:zinc-binding dehydrogenase [Rhizobium sp. P44RR-XXIV]|uniref:zinc-binding dehydrogenase n=1 Tax=Rhizobium sp. P44RR-XXIV TaxID=1921145 RepID=UPI000985B7B6|nr:zinc-binding dehydrogenase [Rhizobium sp. P44RR-XXIV]TIX90495.1 alcohol dehydrogenase [Rhizobium sp. P44RR-XXIV]